MSDMPRILPRPLIEAVELYVERELDDMAKYVNCHPLDESGIWALHALAAKIYAVGWGDGEAAEAERARAARRRSREEPREATDNVGGAS